MIVGSGSASHGAFIGHTVPIMQHTSVAPIHPADTTAAEGVDKPKKMSAATNAGGANAAAYSSRATAACRRTLLAGGCSRERLCSNQAVVRSNHLQQRL